MAVGIALVHLPFDLQRKDTQCSWVVGVVLGGSMKERLMQLDKAQYMSFVAFDFCTDLPIEPHILPDMEEVHSAAPCTGAEHCAEVRSTVGRCGALWSGAGHSYGLVPLWRCSLSLEVEVPRPHPKHGPTFPGTGG